MNYLQEILIQAFEVLFPKRKTQVLLERTSISQYEAIIRPRSIYGVDALLPYSDPRVKALIWELKYKDSTKAAERGGHILSAYLTELLADELTSRAIIIPIPLHTVREKTRGYNQSERLAREIADALKNLELMPHALTRIRDTKRQTTLRGKERLLNMKGAFSASEQVQGKTCVLIDDVVTTGSTLAESKRALLDKGAARVICLCLAYA